MGARYYAAWLGRWTSADPLGIGADGPGVYNYTRGSPVVYVDPGGSLTTDPDYLDGGSGAGPGPDTQAEEEAAAKWALDKAIYEAGGQSVLPEPEPSTLPLPQTTPELAELGGVFQNASNQAFDVAENSDNGLEAGIGYAMGAWMYTLDLSYGAFLAAPGQADLAGQHSGKASLQDDPVEAAKDLWNAKTAAEAAGAPFIGVGIVDDVARFSSSEARIASAAADATGTTAQASSAGSARVNLFYTGEQGRGAVRWHLSIETASDVSMHTELVARGKAGTEVLRASPTRKPDIVYDFDLPDVLGAQSFQQGAIGRSSVPWDRLGPNCATHCADVLSAGGMAGVPTSGGRTILDWIVANSKPRGAP